MPSLPLFSRSLLEWNWEKRPQEPVFTSLMCGHHLRPPHQAGFKGPGPGEISVMHERPAAGPAREQMVQ